MDDAVLKLREPSPEELGLPSNPSHLYTIEGVNYERISRDPGFRRYWREQGAQNEELASRYQARQLRRKLGERQKPFERKTR